MLISPFPKGDAELFPAPPLELLAFDVDDADDVFWARDACVAFASHCIYDHTCHLTV